MKTEQEINDALAIVQKATRDGRLETKIAPGKWKQCSNIFFHSFDYRAKPDPIEPVDEPRRVWVTFQAGRLDGQAWNSERSAKQIIEDYADTCYAEFQQVGPMVRRDDE